MVTNIKEWYDAFDKWVLDICIINEAQLILAKTHRPTCIYIVNEYNTFINYTSRHFIMHRLHICICNWKSLFSLHSTASTSTVTIEKLTIQSNGGNKLKKKYWPLYVKQRLYIHCARQIRHRIDLLKSHTHHTPQWFAITH